MLLIKNGIINTMVDNSPYEADILIQNKKIVDIAQNIKEKNIYSTYDAKGMQIYPGFIDAHSHIGISEEKISVPGDDCNEVTNPITPYLRAVDAINPMDSAFHNALAVGITGAMVGPGSSNPIGGQFAFIKTFGRCIDDMVVLSPSAIKIAFGENPKTNYADSNKMPSTRMTIAAMIRKELFDAKQYFKKNDDNEKKFKFECYRALFDKKIPLKAHAHRTDDIFTAIRIAKEFDLDLTLDHCTEGHLIADEIFKSGYPAIVGPSLTSRSKIEVSNIDFKTSGILNKVGVTVALSTDHPVSRIQYLPLCAALAAKEGLGEFEALKAITINAAKICRVDKTLGSIEIGKDADLTIYNGSPLQISSSAIITIINGEIVWRKKKE